MERLNAIRGPERRKEPELVTPFHIATLQAFAKEMPEKAGELDAVLTEIDRQAVENFGVYESETKPGVSFSYSKLSITPDIIRNLSAKFSNAADAATPEAPAEDESGREDARRQDYFLFTAFSPAPGGNAFTVQDVAIDRFIRLLPQVANAIRTGHTPPEITIYMLGAPTGLGGKVTGEWIDDIKQRGLEPHGELYAEFVQKHAAQTEDARIMLQGVSKGATVAQKTSAALPENLRKHTQRLLDNPAGEHKPGTLASWVSGARVAKGMAQETIARMIGDDMMKTLMKEDAAFVKALSEKKGLVADTSTEKARKNSAVMQEAWALLKGTSLDTESERAFIRRGINDPLTYTRERMQNIQKRQATGNPLPFSTTGKTTEVPFKGSHFFIYDRYKRWAQILDFVKNTK